MKVAADVDLYRKWEEQLPGPRTVDELAGLVGVEAALLRKLSRLDFNASH